jgi:hypothetical protein
MFVSSSSNEARYFEAAERSLGSNARRFIAFRPDRDVVVFVKASP